MNTLKLKFITLSFLATLTVFMTSCEQGEVILNVQDELSIETGKFTKELTMVSENQDGFKLKVSTDNNTLLNLVDVHSFDIEPIFEVPQVADYATSDTELMTDTPNQTSRNLLVIDIEQLPPQGAVGYRITFKSNESINSRYNSISTYFRSTTRKKIQTRNTGSQSIKMIYYDDDVYAGYRSLCQTTTCPQFSYVFSRADVGVGCEYEYWSGSDINVSITFFN